MIIQILPTPSTLRTQCPHYNFVELKSFLCKENNPVTIVAENYNNKQILYSRFLSRTLQSQLRKTELVRDNLRGSKVIHDGRVPYTQHCERISLVFRYLLPFLTTFLHDEQVLQSRFSSSPSLFLSTHVREMSINRSSHTLGMRLRDLSVLPYEAISRDKFLIQLRTFVLESFR